MDFSQNPVLLIEKDSQVMLILTYMAQYSDLVTWSGLPVTEHGIREPEELDCQHQGSSLSCQFDMKIGTVSMASNITNM